MKNIDIPDASLATPARRRWLLGAVAGVSALAGAGLAWRKYQPQSTTPALDNSFWQMAFTTPDGQTLRMSDLRGKPLLLNFWATWCPPCVEELPLLNSFFKENTAKGWQVLGLAVDQLEPVKRFLAKAPLDFPVGMSGMPGLALSKSLGNLSGGLPFSVVFGSDGQVVQRKIGKIKPEDLQAWAAFK
jgi:thiol-disulfide isomerase/thioredoxin